MGSRIITVSQDGSADYRTVQEAIDVVPLSYTCPTVIRVAPGVYKQPIYVPKTNKFHHTGWNPSGGDGAVLEQHGRENRPPSGDACDWDRDVRVWEQIVEGEDFISDITFENSAPEGSGQAVAIRVTADRCVFYNCRFLGWQMM